jgi:DNA-directed RNA polymerase specialized sigma24 family protein
MTRPRPEDIDPAARALIRHKVERLIGSYGFNRSDADDIGQDLAMQAHLARSRFDPTRGTATAFYDTVMSNKVRSIIGHATAQCRNSRRHQALDEQESLAAASEFDIDLQIDVAEALSSLSPADQAVATQLATNTVAAVSRATGMSRGRVRTSRERIARRLLARGLHDPIRRGQPLLNATPYVLGEGASNSLNSRLTGRTAKVVGVRPSPDAHEACPGKGAP